MTTARPSSTLTMDVSTKSAFSTPVDQEHAQIDIDDLELKAQGYTRAMPRRFSPLALISMSYALLATWNGFGSAFGTGFIEASSAGSIWTLTIAGLMTAVTGIGMAELSSAYPIAGTTREALACHLYLSPFSD